MTRRRHERVSAMGLALFLLACAVAGRGWTFNEAAVLTGNDAAMTGGVVTATTRTGSAIWYNPAGVYDIEARSIDFAGSVIVMTIYDVDDILDSERSGSVDGNFNNFFVMPRAFTLVTQLQLLKARVAVGLFQSHSHEISVQEQLVGGAGAGAVEWVADLDEELSSMHGALALAWKLGERLKVGASFDLVFGRRSREFFLTGANSAPGETAAVGVAGGAESLSTNGVGLQLRGGLQWRFAPQWLLGLTLSTPSYLVSAVEEVTQTGIAANELNPGSFASRVDSGLQWGLFGIEPGLVRLGVGYLWGRNWVALDVVTMFPLEERTMGVDQTFVTNVKLGSIFHVAETVRLGIGVLTDFSPEKTPARFGDVQVDLYGFNLGIDFANRAAPPAKGEGVYIAATLSGRYAVGSGKFGALVVADTVGGSTPETSVEPMSTTVQEAVLHVALKVMF